MREETLLTPHSVANPTTFLDWDSQPKMFKKYPDFCYRIALDGALSWLRPLRCITDIHTIAAKPYYRLNVPSAGNLHPIEIYLQIRNIDGIMSGIYHLDVVHQELVMIEEIASSGCEPYLGMDNRFSGYLIFFSLVPFRSSWKYGLRAWRYLYLDLGHQITALHAVLHHNGMTPTKMSEVDIKSLQTVMGMGEDEVIAAVYAVGSLSQKNVKPMKMPLFSVAPCDYMRRDTRLSQSIERSELYHTYYPSYGLRWDEKINVSRRSARAFDQEKHNDALITALFALPCPDSLEIIHIVFQAHSMQLGVYRDGLCIEEGHFRTEIVHLLLDQRFIANASVVSLIFADCFDETSHIEAGIIAQEFYWCAEALDFGCSGIGAFYDELALRWSKRPLIYAVATGGKYDNRSTKRDQNG